MLDCKSFPLIGSACVRWEIPQASARNRIRLASKNRWNMTYTNPKYGDRMKIHQNGSLELKYVRPDDAALYRCRVSWLGRREVHIVELGVTCKGEMICPVKV